MSAGLHSLLMQLGGMRGMEWIFVVIIVVVIFFGVKKIPELARAFGKAGSEFEKAKIEAKARSPDFGDPRGLRIYTNNDWRSR